MNCTSENCVHVSDTTGEPPVIAAFVMLIIFLAQLRYLLIHNSFLVGMSSALIVTMWILFLRYWDRWTVLFQGGLITRIIENASIVVLIASSALLFPLGNWITSLPVLVIGLVVGILAFYESRLDKLLEQNTLIRLLMIIAGSGVFTWYLLSANLKAQWGVIDDHLFICMLGQDKNVSLLDVPTLMFHFEPFGLGGRYRPSLFSVLTLDAFLWGDAPKLWYMSRMIAFWASVVLFWATFRQFFGTVTSAIFLLFCFTYSFWVDVWCKLQPSEIFCQVGLAFFVFGFTFLAKQAPLDARTRKHIFVYWLCLVFGAWLAMGSKENFLLLLIPTWALGVLLYMRASLTRTAIVCIVLTTVYGFIIITSLALGLTRKGHFYGQSLDADYYLMLLLRAFSRLLSSPISWGSVIGIFMLAIATYVICGYKAVREFMKPTWQPLTIILVSVCVYLSQFLFYSGDWPAKNRYDFPGVLTVPFIWLASAIFVMKLFSMLNVPRKLLLAVRVGLLMGLFMLIMADGFAAIKKGCEVNAILTTKFTQKIESISERLRMEPEKPLVVVAANSNVIECYEPTWSILSFLKIYKDVPNPMFLKTTDSKLYPTSFARRLWNALDRSSMNGGCYGHMCEEYSYRYLPLREMDSSKGCFELGLGGPANESECEDLGCIKLKSVN